MYKGGKVDANVTGGAIVCSGDMRIYHERETTAGALVRSMLDRKLSAPRNETGMTAVHT